MRPGVRRGDAERDDPRHRQLRPVRHDASGVFASLPSPFTATRYHSLAVAPDNLLGCLIVNTTGDDGTLQGLRHHDLPILGVQFHPESVASEHGHQLLRNFVEVAKQAQR